jgi:hypothetical protein
MWEVGDIGIRVGRQLLIQHTWQVCAVEGEILKVKFHWPGHGYKTNDVRNVAMSEARHLTAAEKRELGIP